MADSVVSFLLENLSQLLASEAKVLYGVKDSVRSLHNQLQMIDAFLRASDAKRSKKDMEKVVANQIREVAEEAEDVIDTFVTNMTMHKRRSKLGRMIHGVHHAKLLHEVAEKIDSIKGIITDIHDSKIKYELFQQQEGGSTSTREEEERMKLIHKRRRNVEEYDVVGFVHDSELIIQRLMDEDSRKRSSNVVSIIGMGGLGKTTLARKVYNNTEVRNRFCPRAWVYVSNDCRVKELLLGLLKCLMPKHEDESSRRKKKGGGSGGEKQKQRIEEKPQDLSSLSVHDLKQMVHECLRRKRYLLVLDDLWKTQDWDEVQDAFPNDNMGSKILITSRLKEVASHTNPQHPPYYLPFLSDEESWKLFSKTVFFGEGCPSDLEPLGRQIVKSCRGVPLSIIVLAGLLANKEKSHREWSKVVGHVNWYLTQDETQVKDIILKLSYDNLPKRLKPCFLHFGIFPEDIGISVRPLLQTWVAEGFIQQTGTRNPEDVAEDYLYELIDRSLIQVAQVKKITGCVKTCRIHDLLRDLCISESKEDKLYEVCTDYNILARTKPRRLSVHCSMPRYVSSTIKDHSFVRSLFCFDGDYHFGPNQWEWLLKCFKLVRVLDLGINQQGSNIPSNLGMFIHLRYLRIGYVPSVPDSICTLQSLQTLDIAGPLQTGSPISFPARLWKLTQLRHVYTCRTIELRSCYHNSKAEDEVMWNLQTLSSIIILNKQTSYLFEKVRFPKLQKLQLIIPSGRKHELRKLLQSLQHLTHLNKLHIGLRRKDLKGPTKSLKLKYLEWNMGCKPSELLQGLQKMTNLSTLKIMNAFDVLTCAVAFPASLCKLRLEYVSWINDDGMRALGNLTSLRILSICYSSFGGDDDEDDDNNGDNTFDLNCIAGGFPQLQVFEMTELEVRSWKLANGAMPRLQSLVIKSCDKLNSLPNELWSLTDLRKVRVWRPNNELSLMLTSLQMKDGCDLIIE